MHDGEEDTDHRRSLSLDDVIFTYTLVAWMSVRQSKERIKIITAVALASSGRAVRSHTV
jgi:hypothetical protein